jgi:DNA-binding transcriptional MerR regulator
MARKPRKTLAKTQAEAAEKLSITARALRMWEAEDWFPPGGRTDAGWDVELIDVARSKNSKKGGSLDQERQGIRLANDSARARRAKAQAEMAELEVAEKLGELLPRVAIEIHVKGLYQRLRSSFKHLPSVLHVKCGAPVAVVREELNDVLRTIANDIEQTARKCYLEVS